MLVEGKSFELRHDAVDTSALRETMCDRKAGALAVFEGWVRDHHEGTEVVRLSYTAYESLALKTGSSIVIEACARFEVIEARCVHRLGSLEPGDLAVWCGVTAAHRAPAFEACAWIVEAVKRDVPIWKEEFFADGRVEWVDPTKPAPSRNA